MLLSTGSALFLSQFSSLFTETSVELFYFYPNNAPTVMFSIISDTEISEMLIPRNIDFFLTCCLKEYDRLFCLVFLHPSIIAYYIILSTKYHMIDLWKCWDIAPQWGL